jgi:nanoRNase/pAp phosphatase (c-di-AMP/oligoRNAs hydrolase)
MLSRLVLGAGPTALTLVDAVSDDAGDLVVVTPDEHRAETLRDDGIVVVRGDPTDRRVLADIDIDPDTVVVATDESATNAAVADVVADLYPDAFVLGYAGRGATDEQADRIRSVADRFVDPVTAVTDHLDQSVGAGGTRIRHLQRVLRDIDGELAIVTHDNPDPDAIGSAVALAELAERAGCAVSVCYYGEIAHQENRAFVNLLEYDLTNLDADDPDALDAFGAFALVDHSRPGVNDQLPSDLDIDIVIDHHPPRLPVEGRFVDLRSGVGATSTLLVDYFRRLDIDMPEPIATGLLFGIRVDTKDFRREVAADDFEAAAHLVTRADMNALQRIEDPSVSAETLSTIGREADKVPSIALANSLTSGKFSSSSIPRPTLTRTSASVISTSPAPTSSKPVTSEPMAPSSISPSTTEISASPDWVAGGHSPPRRVSTTRSASTE